MLQRPAAGGDERASCGDGGAALCPQGLSHFSIALAAACTRPQRDQRSWLLRSFKQQEGAGAHQVVIETLGLRRPCRLRSEPLKRSNMRGDCAPSTRTRAHSNPPSGIDLDRWQAMEYRSTATLRQPTIEPSKKQDRVPMREEPTSTTTRCERMPRQRSRRAPGGLSRRARCPSCNVAVWCSHVPPPRADDCLRRPDRRTVA